MNRRISCSLLTALLLISFSHQAYAGPWTKKQGEMYAKLSELVYSSDTFVSASGQRVQGAEFMSFSSALYAEFGLLDGLHIQTFVPYVWATNTFANTQGSTTYGNLGFGDAIIGLQWTPIQTSVPWALRIDTKVPMYDVAGIKGPSATQFPVFGDGQIDVTAWLSGGLSFYPFPGYTLLEVGYRHRTEVFLGAGNGQTYGDSIALAWQGGVAFMEGFWTVINVNGVFALTEDNITQSFLTVGPGIALNVWQGLSVEATFDWMLYAKNNAPGPSASLGLSYKANFLEGK